ncbi:MAG: murein hydrolase activator EnvC family protein [Myxococcota bacterium]
MILLWLLSAIAQDQRRLLDEIRAFDEQIGTLESQVDALEQKATAVRAEAAGHRAALADAEGELAARRGETTSRIQTFYRLKRRGLARLLFDAESPAELRRRVRYLLAVIRADEKRTREFTEIVSTRKTAAEKLAADEKVVTDLQRELDGRIAALKGERDQRQGLLRDIRGTPQLAMAYVREKAAAVAEMDESIRQREATAPAPAVQTFRELKGRLPAPVSGKVLHRFGAYTDPLSGQTVSNTGLDYATTFGAPVRAVADGTVTRAGYVRGFGQVVVVEHGSYQTLYAHFNGLRVATGQAVKRGDTLGSAGNTGLAEDAEARLHFEVRYNGTPQDPGEWLSQ